MKVKLTIALACACALGMLVGASALLADTGSEPPSTTTPTSPTEPVRRTLSQHQRQRRIDRYRHAVWHWQRVMGRPVTRRLPNAPDEFWEKVSAWKRVAVHVARHAQNPPHKGTWLCIHRYEASWRDANAPYYGGLQMDLGFQQRYGTALLRRKGTAEHWTPLEQMWVAERALRAGRGFYPWPNSARICGVL